MKMYSRKNIQWIAMFTMLLDHIACSLISQEELPALYFLLRMLGRLAFPLFCFMLTEGIRYTRSVFRYLLRIGGFALLSEIPFDLAITGKIVDCSGQNVLFTMLLGLLALQVMRLAENTVLLCDFWKKLLQCLPVLAAGIVAEFLQTDYGFWGICLIAVFYLGCQDSRKRSLLVTLVIFLMGPGEWPAVCSLYFVNRYQAERRESMPKWFLYFFYPLHLLFLALLSFLIMDIL